MPFLHPCKNGQYASRKAELKPKRDYGTKDINYSHRSYVLEEDEVTKECIKSDDSKSI